MKRIFSLGLAALILALSFAGCAKQPENTTDKTASSQATTADTKSTEVTTVETGVVKDTEFQNIYIDGMTIEEFNTRGFAFGDSLNIRFDNGQTLEDVPYYSGYYTPVGALLACGYPSYPHVVIARNYGKSTWEEFGMTDASKVTVTLNEKGKYLEIEELYALSYSNERKDFDSDVTFANFRAVKGGKLKPDTFFRSASPCDDRLNRAAYANKLAEEAGIRFVINLSDSEDSYREITAQPGFQSAYYDGLYQAGNVLLLGLNANYRADAFAKTLSEAFLAMTEHETPVLIHCVEGKDRTGFACALLLALADATAQEIVDDYMITYANYYGITKEKKKKKYEAILGNVYDFLYCLCDAPEGTPLDSLELKAGAENYLRRGGLGDAQISAVEQAIA